MKTLALGEWLTQRPGPKRLPQRKLCDVIGPLRGDALEDWLRFTLGEQRPARPVVLP